VSGSGIRSVIGGWRRSASGKLASGLALARAKFQFIPRRQNGYHGVSVPSPGDTRRGNGARPPRSFGVQHGSAEGVKRRWTGVIVVDPDVDELDALGTGIDMEGIVPKASRIDDVVSKFLELVLILGHPTVSVVRFHGNSPYGYGDEAAVTQVVAAGRTSRWQPGRGLRSCKRSGTG